MSGRLQGRFAIVTGAASPIGRAASVLLAREGAAVCACDADGAAAATVAAEIVAAGGRAIDAACDVADPQAVEALFEAVEGALGPVDLVYNGAAVAVVGDATATATDDWRHALAVNLGGVWNTSRSLIVRARRDRRGGVIVNGSAAAASHAEPDAVATIAAGGGVVGLTRALALDHALEGIRVNCVLFGDDPDAVARAILFLASDASSFVTGATVTVDGGWSSGRHGR